MVSTSRFENQIKVVLPANSTLTLQMYPAAVAGAAVLVGGGAGASLTIIRLEEAGVVARPAEEHDTDIGIGDE